MENYGIQWVDVMKYSKMVHLYNDKDFDPRKQKSLDLSNQKITGILSAKVMAIFTNLIELDLSKNLIVNFDGTILLNYCKKLEKISFDDNLIDDLVDFIPLGQLENLSSLSLLGNPVSKRKEGLPLLEELLFPPSLKKYSIVEIFTATYEFVPNSKETIQNEQIDPKNIVYDEDVARMGLQNFRSEEKVDKPITLFKKMRWISSVIDKPCPKRKVGIFRNLMKLNGKQITIFDAFMITGAKKADEFVTVELEEKTKEKLRRTQSAVQTKQDIGLKGFNKAQSKLTTEYYLRKYQRKMDMIAAQFEPIHFLNDDMKGGESNYLQVIYKIDRINDDRRRMGKEHQMKQKGWDTKAFDKYMTEPDVPISLGELAREGIKLHQIKEAKRLKQQREEEEYKEKLRKIYKFKKRKDEKFEKAMKGLDIDGIDPKELEKYDKYVLPSKKKRFNKKVKLRLEAQPEEIENSFEDEDISAKSHAEAKEDSNSSIEDLDMRLNLGAISSNGEINEIGNIESLSSARRKKKSPRKDQDKKFQLGNLGISNVIEVSLV